jgi:hypothetical protein
VIPHLPGTIRRSGLGAATRIQAPQRLPRVARRDEVNPCVDDRDVTVGQTLSYQYVDRGVGRGLAERRLIGHPPRPVDDGRHRPMRQRRWVQPVRAARKTRREYDVIEVGANQSGGRQPAQ